MAIFGRGQPHQPIFLRTAAAGAVVVFAATLLPIHVISLAADRQALPKHRRASVTFFHNAATQPATVGVGSPIHVITAIDNPPTWRHPARESDVLFLRNPQVPPAPPAVKAVRPVVVLAPFAPRGAAHQARDGDVIVVRAPRTNDRGPQIHVVEGFSRLALRPAIRGRVIQLRNAATQPATVALPQPKVIEAFSRLALRPSIRGRVIQLRNPATQPATVALPQPKVVAIAPIRNAIHPARDSDVVFLRAPQAAVVAVATTPKPVVVLVKRKPTAGHVVQGHNAATQPATVALPQPKVVLALPLRGAVHASRDADIIFLRNPQAPVVVSGITVSPIHLTLQTRERVSPKGLVAYVRPSRTSLVPDRLAPQFHVISTAVLTNPRHPDRDSDPTFRGRRVIFLRTPLAPLPTKQITVVAQKRIVPVVVERRHGIIALRAPTIFARASQPIHVVQQRRPKAVAPKGDVLQLRAPTIVVAPAAKAQPFRVISQAGRRPRERTAGRGHVVFVRNGKSVVVGDIAARAVKLREVPDFVRLHRNLADPGTPTYFDGEYYFDGSIYYDGSVFGQAAANITDVVHARKLHEGPGGDFGAATYFDGTYDFDGVIDYDGGIKTGGSIQIKSTSPEPKARKLRDV